jgi:hypothetical protein
MATRIEPILRGVMATARHQRRSDGLQICRQHACKSASASDASLPPRQLQNCRSFRNCERHSVLGLVLPLA